MNPYSWVIKSRDYLFKRNIFKSKEFLIPIISVGNINTGGSGKTPFIIFLVSELKMLYPKLRILIICKSYKASIQIPSEITSDLVFSPNIFGDEACLLKKCTDADVWSGPVKVQTLTAALEVKTYDVAIIDDGFSHLKIKRDLDIVLFDASREEKHYRLIPRGHLREPFSSLARSSFVVLTKSEMQPNQQIENYKKQIHQHQKNILMSEFNIKLDSHIKSIVLLTAIGNSGALVLQLEQLGIKLVEHLKYSDHYSYTETDQIKILNTFRQHQKFLPNIILMSTEKDLVKITHQKLRNLIIPIELKVTLLKKEMDYFHEKIRSLF